MSGRTFLAAREKNDFLKMMLKYRCRILFTTRSRYADDKIGRTKDGGNKKAAAYNHIHTLISLYRLSKGEKKITDRKKPGDSNRIAGLFRDGRVDVKNNPFRDNI